MGWGNVTLQMSCGLLLTVLSLLAVPHGAAATASGTHSISDTTIVGPDDAQQHHRYVTAASSLLLREPVRRELLQVRAPSPWLL
jgi:hypothetical protein